MRKTRIPATPRPSGSAPRCKQCLEGSVVNPATGQSFKFGNEHVVRFMGAWACLLHFMVDVKGQGKQPLGTLITNRAHRKQLLRRANAKA